MRYHWSDKILNQELLLHDTGWKHVIYNLWMLILATCVNEVFPSSQTCLPGCVCKKQLSIEATKWYTQTSNLKEDDKSCWELFRGGKCTCTEAYSKKKSHRCGGRTRKSNISMLSIPHWTMVNECYKLSLPSYWYRTATVYQMWQRHSPNQLQVLTLKFQNWHHIKITVCKRTLHTTHVKIGKMEDSLNQYICTAIWLQGRWGGNLK